MSTLHRCYGDGVGDLSQAAAVTSTSTPPQETTNKSILQQDGSKSGLKFNQMTVSMQVLRTLDQALTALEMMEDIMYYLSVSFS